MANESAPNSIVTDQQFIKQFECLVEGNKFKNEFELRVIIKALVRYTANVDPKYVHYLFQQFQPAKSGFKNGPCKSISNADYNWYAVLKFGDKEDLHKIFLKSSSSPSSSTSSSGSSASSNNSAKNVWKYTQVRTLASAFRIRDIDDSDPVRRNNNEKSAVLLAVLIDKLYNARGITIGEENPKVSQAANRFEDFLKVFNIENIKRWKSAQLYFNLEEYGCTLQDFPFLAKIPIKLLSIESTETLSSSSMEKSTNEVVSHPEEYNNEDSVQNFQQDIQTKLTHQLQIYNNTMIRGKQLSTELLQCILSLRQQKTVIYNYRKIINNTENDERVVNFVNNSQQPSSSQEINVYGQGVNVEASSSVEKSYNSTENCNINSLSAYSIVKDVNDFSNTTDKNYDNEERPMPKLTPVKGDTDMYHTRDTTFESSTIKSKSDLLLLISNKSSTIKNTYGKHNILQSTLSKTTTSINLSQKGIKRTHSHISEDQKRDDSDKHQGEKENDNDIGF